MCSRYSFHNAVIAASGASLNRASRPCFRAAAPAAPARNQIAPCRVECGGLAGFREISGQGRYLQQVLGGFGALCDRAFAIHHQFVYCITFGGREIYGTRAGAPEQASLGGALKRKFHELQWFERDVERRQLDGFAAAPLAGQEIHAQFGIGGIAVLRTD